MNLKSNPSPKFVDPPRTVPPFQERAGLVRGSHSNSWIRIGFMIGFFLILSLPLLNLPPWFSPPDWGKTIVFRIVMSLMIFFFLWQILQKENFGTVQHMARRGSAIKIVLALLILLFLFFLVSTLFSRDTGFSFWGDPYRSGGFLNFSFYIIFAIFTFLILKDKDWQKIWNFSFIIGIFVSVIAILQQFGIFAKVFIGIDRPPSTLGGPTFLAIYLLLLSFPLLSHSIKEKVPLKKLSYCSTLIFFIAVIVAITRARAALLGFLIGGLWFLFVYPKKLFFIKFFAGIILISTILGFYFLKTHPEIYLNQSYIIRNAAETVLSIPKSDEGRISAWKISFGAMKEKPFFGWGMENFSIGFDKYYNPSLPGIENVPTKTEGAWWDRAHNFIFDIGVTAGIPALVIYLSIFVILFFQLQKLKNADSNPKGEPSVPCGAGAEKTPKVIYHGIQTTLIAYLVTDFFSFDTFSSYLISFLLIGYSLHLLSSQANRNQTTLISMPTRANFWGVLRRCTWYNLASKILKWKKSMFLFLLIIVGWFVYSYNIKPFLINAQINIARNLSDNAKNYNRALTILENQASNHSILDHYLRLEYGEIVGDYIYERPEMAGVFANKARNALLENIKIRPYYLRNWLVAGTYTNILLEKETNPATKESLKRDANFCFEKSIELAPKRQEIFIEWLKTDLLTGDYKLAKEKAQKCIDLNPELSDCWWWMGLTNLYLDEKDESQKNIQIAIQKGSNPESKSSLLQLSRVYTETENYKELAKILPKLIAFEPANPQYHASLALVCKELGDFKKAREQALEVLKLAPDSKEQVEIFLNSLPY